MKSVIKGRYKANVGAGAGVGTFWKSEPERKQKVSAPQHRFADLTVRDTPFNVDGVTLLETFRGLWWKLSGNFATRRQRELETVWKNLQKTVLRVLWNFKLTQYFSQGRQYTLIMCLRGLNSMRGSYRRFWITSKGVIKRFVLLKGQGHGMRMS